ncbi:MAG: dihydropteroate synthase, partial [Actinobacteria bacterium]
MSSRSGIWRCGRFSLSLERPLVMGIVNVTPDSFSDGGANIDPRSAIAHAEEMLADGAAIVDVGGESTRPGSDEVDPAEELARVLPVVTALASAPVPVSVDTRHAAVARACVGAGASIINDVAGFRDHDMIVAAAACDAGAVVMHMLGEPKSM